MAHDLRAIWQALGEDELIRPEFALENERGCLVWREGERPTFMLVEADEVRAFQAMQRGTGYGQVCMKIAGEGEAAEPANGEDALRGGAKWGGGLSGGGAQRGGEGKRGAGQLE